MMLSNKPYLIRALYQWIIDSQHTPFLVINTNHVHCRIPQELIEEEQITLNISPHAIRDLDIGNQFIKFRASFTGLVHLISAPIQAVLAIYAQENGQGMFFDSEEINAKNISLMSTDNSHASTNPTDSKKNLPHLKLVE